MHLQAGGVYDNFNPRMSAETKDYLDACLKLQMGVECLRPCQEREGVFLEISFSCINDTDRYIMLAAA